MEKREARKKEKQNRSEYKWIWNVHREKQRRWQRVKCMHGLLKLRCKLHEKRKSYATQKTKSILFFPIFHCQFSECEKYRNFGCFGSVFAYQQVSLDTISVTVFLFFSLFCCFSSESFTFSLNASDSYFRVAHDFRLRLLFFLRASLRVSEICFSFVHSVRWPPVDISVTFCFRRQFYGERRNDWWKVTVAHYTKAQINSSNVKEMCHKSGQIWTLIWRRNNIKFLIKIKPTKKKQ